MKWINAKRALPVPKYGDDEHPKPYLSDDVLVVFESGDSIYDIANYDHAEKQWSLPNKGFNQPDVEPIAWIPIPALPDTATK